LGRIFGLSGPPFTLHRAVLQRLARDGWEVNDHVAVEAGATIVQRAERHTFFGQFEDDSSVYTGNRYGF